MRLKLFLPLLLILLNLHPAAAQNSEPQTVLATMTLEQKVAQMFLVGLYGPVLNEPGRDFLQQWQPGGVVLFDSNAGQPAQVTALINSWQQTVVDAGGVPLFVTTDQEGGTIARLKDGFTVWPVPMLLTASGKVELAYRTGQAMANELSAVGINMNLAPVADLYTNLQNPVIGRRSFGSDPERTGQMLAALIRGMQAGGIMATAKHFPGHGDTDHDSHTSLPVVRYPLEELEKVEFAPFRWTIAAGVEAMMVAHIWYPALNPEGSIPASLSPQVITGLLREDLNFRGLIMTDAIEMDAIDTQYSYGEASILAINAGVDIVAFGAHLNPNNQAEAMQDVVNAVRDGQISESRIDTSVLKILDGKARYGILDWTPLDAPSASSRMDSLGHAELVTELFQAGVTLAYDKNSILPLDGNRSVMLIYPGSRPSIKGVCSGIYPPELTRWLSVSDNPSSGEINGAVNGAASADVVVVFTQNAGSSSGQQALVNALPGEKTAAVALFSPYDWQSFPNVSAYLTTYSPLDPGIPAVCDVLFGVQPATGQLPVALDGQRDFASFVATEGITINTSGVAVALAPRETVTPLPTLTPVLLTVTPTELPVTPTITETRAPLLSSTRVAVVVPPLDNQPTAQVVDALPGTGNLALMVPPPAATNLPLPLMFGLGGVGLVLMTYAGLYAQGQRMVQRYKRGFVVQRCPVCSQGKLQVETLAKRRFGLPYVSKRTVKCPTCRSVLREVSSGQWKYRINPVENPKLHQRWHDKVVDEGQLRGFSKQ
ncbi:MAG: beta-N-acetylhexosaminidase [Anaerolineae bacterium]|nr:beta-N-acetylhexosaminidase [Anaerolineae bacterium]